MAKRDINRRQAMSAVSAPLLAAGAAGAAGAAERATAPGLTFAFRATVTLDPPQELGTIEGQRKRIIPITGGVVSGPKLNGIVLPGGADWQSIRPDGVTHIYARYTLKAEDGTLISIINPGVRRGPEDVMRRLVAGERVDPTLYYFKTTPTFDAGGAYAWLMESVWVSVGKRWPDSVEIEYYSVD